MKTATTLSLMLNVLLAGLVVWLACAGPRSQARADFSRFLTNRVLRVKHPLALLTPANESTPQVIAINEPFSWAQLESSDYRVYLTNLRAIGCPEPTVRDLIVADVNDLFAPRVKALVDEVTGQFWNLMQRPQDFEKMVDAKHDQLRALRDERGAVFEALFENDNPHAGENLELAAAERRENWERLADFLPEEKRVRYAAANEEWERAWTEYLKTPNLTGPQQQAKRKELDASHQTALAEWLTPEELSELRLRNSSAASLRDRVVGLELSEAETLLAAQLQLAKDEARVKKAAPPEDNSLRELLGPERFAAFERARDSRYESLYRVAQRLELPDAVAVQAYDIRVQAEQAALRLRADKSFTADARAAALQAIASETKQSLAIALSAQGLAAYEKIDGGWLQQMTSAKP